MENLGQINIPSSTPTGRAIPLVPSVALEHVKRTVHVITKLDMPTQFHLTRLLRLTIVGDTCDTLMLMWGGVGWGGLPLLYSAVGQQ